MGQHALAVGVDVFGKRGDALAELQGQAGVLVGEGEGFEANRLYVARSIFESAAGRLCPFHVKFTTQHTQVNAFLQSKHHGRAITHCIRRHKNESPMLGGK